MIHIYTLLYCLALLLIFPFEYLKRPKALRKTWLPEKFGKIDGGDTARGDGTIWIHAVSVGEVLAALPLIKELRASGHGSIVLSTITDTGRQIALEKAPDDVRMVYLPFDLKCALRKAIARLSPCVFMTMETELWPNLFVSMKEAGVPVFIFNGRISDRSFPGYRKIAFFLRRLFDAVAIAGVQTEQDAGRFEEMGMSREKVKVIGNFKFDIHGTLEAPPWTKRLRGGNIVCGSTHEGEEEAVIAVYAKLRERSGTVNLILAPRHPQRFNAVEKLLNTAGERFVKRSELDDGSGELRDCIILIDVLGELAGLYAVADVSIIGGSFVPVGGHNLFEPAYWSKPIVCGPHMNNFPLTGNFEKADAVRIAEKEGLYDIVSELMDSDELRERLGRNAHKVFLDNSGAVHKAVALLRPYLER